MGPLTRATRSEKVQEAICLYNAHVSFVKVVKGAEGEADLGIFHSEGVCLGQGKQCLHVR